MRISSIPKFLASFFKSEWSFDDYPIVAREQNTQERDDIPKWVAGVDGLYLTGLGNTRAEAIEDLRSSFKNYVKDRSSPRPGTQAPIEFADTGNIERLGEFAYAYVEAAAGVRPFFLSDESSFSDFSSVAEFEGIAAYTLEHYGLNISNRASDPIWKIVDAIQTCQYDG